MSRLLAEKIAIVTGGGRGLGAAIAEGLAREGAQVIVVDRDLKAAQEVVRTISAAGGKAESVELDISDREGVLSYGRSVIERFGTIDILVNNAGISPRVNMDDKNLLAMWDRVIDVNLNGQWDMTVALLPALKKPGASLIFIASIAAFTAPRSSAAYGAAKAGIRSLVQYFARELGQYGARANALAPGRMLTDMIADSVNTPSAARFLERVPLGRNGEAHEIAGPAVFLASSMSSYVTGTTIPVDGGFLAV
jgi:meso-butanediol dehydrogenase/(S,S)-butanediol dehydrogenase/diacetyl reductase